MPAQESEASCRMLRELCLRSGVLVPPELMQSSSGLTNASSLQVESLSILVQASWLQDRVSQIELMICLHGRRPVLCCLQIRTTSYINSDGVPIRLCS